MNEPNRREDARVEATQRADESDRERDFGVAGERGIPAIGQVPSVQSRVTTFLTLSLTILLGGGLLYWYYSGALQRAVGNTDKAHRAHQARSQGEGALPPLGNIPTPNSAPGTYARVDTNGDPSAYAPEIPLHPAVANAPTAKTPAELIAERRLAGPVLMRTGGMGSGEGSPRPARLSPEMMAAAIAQTGTPGSMGAGEPDSLAEYLKPTALPAVAAQVLPTQSLLLPKGAFVDCTLETAVSSALPGMTTCITATDTFSADGSVILMERGTKLVGETRGQVQAGASRLFVLWSEARTPTGVVVPLASPGTDELGRSGLTGVIDRHWWQRFGAAILVSIIDGAVQGVAQGGRSNTVVLNPSQSSSVLTEVLKNTIQIAPTVDIAAGEKIQILVARDVDFRSVYALRGTP